MKQHFVQKNSIALAVGIALMGGSMSLPSYALASATDVSATPAPAAASGDAATPVQNDSTPSAPPSTDQSQKKVDDQVAAESTTTTPANAKKSVTTLNTVTVVGQLRSLEQAAATKRDAVGIVDSVSAEEAGQFPDTNVADALQRVPGVSVDRSGGESDQITVRGFGPSFVNVLVNGRTMATANTGRAFDFDVLPAELIQQAVVHKTGMANLPSGGIGGTVDLITSQPGDFDGFHTSFSAAGINDSNGGGLHGKVTPKVDFMIGDSNADHTFGWLVSGLYYKRDHVEQAVEADGWDMGLDLSAIDPSLTNVSAPQTVQADYWPQTYIRKSINGAIDWKPTDKLSIKFNSLWTGFQQTGQESSLGSFFIPQNISSAKVDGNGTALTYTRTGINVPDDLVMANDYIEASTPQNTKSYMTGINATYQFSPSTELDFDSYASKSWNKPGANGYFTVVGTKNFDRIVTWNNNGSDLLPSYSGLTSTTDLNDLKAHYLGAGSQNATGQVQGNKLHLSTEFLSGPLTRVDFGINNTNDTKRLVSYSLPGPPGNSLAAIEYSGYVADIPGSAIGAHVLNAGSMINSLAPGEPTQWVTYDEAKLMAYYASAAAYSQLPDPGDFAAQLAGSGVFTPVPQPISFSDIHERTRSAYGMATFEDNLWTIPWQLNLGVRFTTTDTVSTGIGQTLLSVRANPLDITAVIPTFGPTSPLATNGVYHNWLPSLNFKLNLLQNVVFRFGFSKTLTRPDLGSLASGQTWGFDNVHLLTLAEGNAALQPFTSLNYDAGIEWYISGPSYLAFDVFHKKVNNFTTSITSLDTMFGYPFMVTRPVNLNSARVRGAEATFNYQFTSLPTPFDGFGIGANYTYVHSDASASPDLIATTGQFAIPGMGNSYNANLYYQKYGAQVRLAWNWRGHYLSSISNDAGFPETTTPYGQLDLSASYALTTHLSVFLEGTNLNNERIHSYQIFQNMADYAEADGQTWTTGVRGTW
ncbi:MAG: TonB-dependent receptor [Rhodanobacter sp.]